MAHRARQELQCPRLSRDGAVMNATQGKHSWTRDKEERMPVLRWRDNLSHIQTMAAAQTAKALSPLIIPLFGQGSYLMTAL
eukprot:3938037-Rhodomonas_salina.1